MIDFSKRIKNGTQVKKINPIEIYNSLDRASVTGPLRPVQANVLQEWFSESRAKRDLIIKLHTGAGKTLVGLLIAMSYINSNEGPSIYICPNIYLMQQACADAQKFGVPFCIVNQSNEIPDDFIQGKSVLITYVQKVFNGLSIFGTGNRSINAGCIILDDSHACIESMLGSCTIQLLHENQAYGKLLTLFHEELEDQGKGTLQDLLNNRSNALMPIPYWAWQSKMSEVTRIIAEQVEDNHVKFAWPIIRDQLDDCIAFISNNKIEIRPLCMPIEQYGIFNNAHHRILMSATTQEDTFFIKGLGLSIEAVASPLVDKNYRWAGEKMVLIPAAICEHANAEDLIDRVIAPPHDFGIAVLTPSFDKARRYTARGAKLINNPEAPNTMYQLLKKHIEAPKNQTIVFANRYDGIDLPDDTCRVLIIDSVPYYDSLSDRYEELCRSESEIRLVKYYSCDYKTLRSSSLGKQLLYSKPFVKTQRNTYFLSSLYSLGMTIGNGLYWVVRDYFRIQGTQKFVNAFGLLFEDYIIDIANKYCRHSEWHPLPKEKGKGADFLFSFAGVQIVVEAKSALLQLDGKQQEPNDSSIKKFFNNTINEAYEQLKSSCSRLFSDTQESVIKVILLYDEFSNTAIIEESMRDLFYSDPQCFVMTIRELEILLYLHKNDPPKSESVVHQMISTRKSESGRMNFGAILDDHQIFDNEHLKGEMDYFSILLEQYKG